MKKNDHLPRWVYRILNLLDGKSYIGITQTSRFNKRMKEHVEGLGSSKNSLIHRAIKLYGEENFVFQIIDAAENEAIAKEKEIFYIAHHQTLYSQHGYNLTKGGNHLPPSKMATEKAQKNRKTKKVNSSSYIGVYFDSKKNKWVASYKELSRLFRNRVGSS